MLDDARWLRYNLELSTYFYNLYTNPSVLIIACIRFYQPFFLNSKITMYSRLCWFLFIYTSPYESGCVCNPGHYILRLFDVWPNFPFTTSETKFDY